MNKLLSFKNFPFIYNKREKKLDFEQCNELTIYLLDLPVNPAYIQVELNNTMYDLYTGESLTEEEAKNLLKIVFEKRKKNYNSLSTKNLLYWNKGEIMMLKDRNGLSEKCFF